MQLKTFLSFKAGSFSGKDYLTLIEKTVDFKIAKFEVDEIKESELKWDKKYLDKIAKCSSEAELIFRAKEEKGVLTDEFRIMESAYSKTPQVLYWFLENRHLSNELLLELSSHKNFTTGYICDANFLMWQNETSVYNYEYAGKKHSHLPKYYDKDFKLWLIDIKKINPGRSSMVDSMWLQASFKMLFGEHFFQYVSKEKLKSYPNAYKIEEWPNGVLFIQLYEDITKSDAPEMLSLMKDFREWIEMDKLEKELE